MNWSVFFSELLKPSLLVSMLSNILMMFISIRTAKYSADTSIKTTRIQIAGDRDMQIRKDRADAFAKTIKVFIQYNLSKNDSSSLSSTEEVISVVALALLYCDNAAAEQILAVQNDLLRTPNNCNEKIAENTGKILYLAHLLGDVLDTAEARSTDDQSCKQQKKKPHRSRK